ncbi:MAG: hypothetical protein Ct9H300mP28_02810 [Pseudomonadota bacterium]|nr:MAG: hypothetical protein Ct9H300mP28_02810 [Pseudomonadota bacterium]
MKDPNDIVEVPATACPMGIPFLKLLQPPLVSSDHMVHKIFQGREPFKKKGSKD